MPLLLLLLLSAVYYRLPHARPLHWLLTAVFAWHF